MYIIIDNYDSFTYNIYQYLCELTSKEVKVFRNDRITLAEIEALNPEGLIISPGPGRPEEAGISIQALRYFAGKVPILGVCLGHQGIGYAFGGEIIGAKEIVHGKTNEVTHDGRGVFRGLPNPAVFTRYHSLVINPENLPECLEISARSPDGEIMAVRHKTLPIEGVQFHPESIASDHGKQLLKNFLKYRREPFPFRKLLNKVQEGQDLTQVEAADFMEELTDGNLTPAQIAAMLVAINAKGIKAPEVAGCAQVLQRKRTPFPYQGETLDTCGTGGDEIGSFNISSFSALIAAAAGVPVAKHGNRAVSSKSGSSEFYHQLGIYIELSPDKAAQVLRQTGFTFLFAPVYHSAMKYAAPVRKELGIKTIMNLLGPLSNPAGAAYQVLGVYSDELAPTMAQAAGLLGVKKVLVVHSQDGMDEISPAAPTNLYQLDAAGNVVKTVFDPASLGIQGYKLADILGGSASENAIIAREILSGAGPGAVREAVCLNAGAALWVAGKADSLEQGYARAKEALESGAVKTKLAQVAALTQALY